MRQVTQCEHCGEDLGGPVDKWGPDDPITCGQPECERWARDCARGAREEAHEELDRIMRWD